ncbi:hypothetical protein TcasGA2_TC008236 [Tribolium castaneum]|nr:hypothetical protein TcasGA2_TC008236 [Tribolium castaneum]
MAKEKKISLEDIERDNLKTTGKIARAPPKIPVASPTDYGFVPTKTVTDYARQQPKYVQYVPQTYAQPAQQYTPPPQQYATVPQQYYYQQQQSVQNPYQQYENVQYVTDNSIAQAQQQYYTPQYVYLQQYTAPSTAIQSVVDPKGGIQYVMYVVPKAEQTQNYENVVYTNSNEQQQYVVPQTQYVQTQQVTPEIKYAPQPEKPQQLFTKSEPKSLLDSYVPSILQVQYYKQQQAQANAIQHSLKDVSTVSGKSSYRPTQISHNSAESVINYHYQLPSIQQQHQ